MTLINLKPPKKFLVNFSQFFDAALISTPNCHKMAKDIDQDNLRINFF